MLGERERLAFGHRHECWLAFLGPGGSGGGEFRLILKAAPIGFAGRLDVGCVGDVLA